MPRIHDLDVGGDGALAGRGILVDREDDVLSALRDGQRRERIGRGAAAEQASAGLRRPRADAQRGCAGNQRQARRGEHPSGVMSGHGGSSACGSAIDDADALVVRVRDVKVSFRVQRDAARPIEPRGGCRAAVARESGPSRRRPRRSRWCRRRGRRARSRCRCRRCRCRPVRRRPRRRPGRSAAPSVAGPPSPSAPICPVPATVVIMPAASILRTRLLFVSAM